MLVVVCKLVELCVLLLFYCDIGCLVIFELCGVGCDGGVEVGGGGGVSGE